MDNNTQHQKEDRVMKMLAILGFVVAAIFIAWLAIQIVRFIPGAFSSLASLADGLNGRDTDELEVAVSESTVGSRTAMTISWTDLGEDGTYTFAYECVGGVSLDVRIGTNGVVPVECDEPYALPQGTFSIEAVFASERDRFVDVPFTIAFEPASGDEDDRRERERVVTVVNASIPLAGTDPDDIAADDTDTDEDETDDDTVALGGPELPYTGYDGHVELVASFKDVGMLTGTKFTPSHAIDADGTGAFRFTVTNTGTKTSGEWYFNATLTNGTGYESGNQEALQPGESIVVTVAFENAGGAGIQRFGATIAGGGDTDASNNSFTRSVAVSR